MSTVIIDYGSGNLRSAAKAFERAACERGAGETIRVTADPEAVRVADRIVLPGVGAFRDCRDGLKAIAGMWEVLDEQVGRRGKPFLGICVGMQLMASRGLEHGVTEGFGWIAGDVKPVVPDDPGLKVPHMGWNTLEACKPHALLDTLPLGPLGLHAYFVHSYQLAAADPADRSNWVRGVECKKVSWRLSSLWGEPGTDEVMPSYLLQCQQGMAVTGLELWELPVTIGGEPPVVYRIERDDELIQMILDAGADFVARIESGEPPVLDNTEAYADYLASRHPWSRDEYLVATPEIEAVAETLRETQALYKQAEEDIKGLKNQIAAFVGDASGVETSLGKVNYKTRRGRPDPMAVIDHLAEAYTIPRSEIDELLAANRYKDSRPVQAYWRKGSK